MVHRHRQAIISMILTLDHISLSIGQKQLLNDLSLSIAPGTLHALMGPNGSGKSSLAHAIMGVPGPVVTQGTIQFNGVDITDLPIHKRAQQGIFLVFQHPYEIPGVTVRTLLKEAYQARTGRHSSVSEFSAILYKAMDQLQMDHSYADRPVNEGFSGGEKKRLELLQAMVLKPELLLIDEIDSGLDVDALDLVARTLSQLRKELPQMAIIIITHYPRILDYLSIDAVHVLAQGALHSHSPAIIQEIEQYGYAMFMQERS